MSAPAVVIVLASGRGVRFRASGGSGSKLQALLGGRTVLARTLEAVHRSGLPWHLEDGVHEGMGDAIAAGVRATFDAPAWLILPGDLPLIQPSTLQRIAEAPSAHDAVVPVMRGRRGHPVRFSARCGLDLMRLTGPLGAASIVRARGAVLCPVEDEGCFMDIDTLDDLARAERLLGSLPVPFSSF